MGTIQSIIKKIQQQEITCVELMRQSLAAIDSNNDSTNAFIELFHDHALSTAADLDQKIIEGTAPAYAGVPFGIKDNMCFENHGVYLCIQYAERLYFSVYSNSCSTSN